MLKRIKIYLKKKEIVRLLGTEDFKYYKTHGHHRNYIRPLARLKDCLTADATYEHRDYWSQIQISHFLFTAQEIESNSFFFLKYSTQCLGSYFVDGSDINNLDRILHRYDQVRSIASEILNWPKKIEQHKEKIKRDGIEDSVIENFQIQRLTAITNGYGKQAINNVLYKLEDWHDQHYWKPKKTKSQVDVPENNAITT